MSSVDQFESVFRAAVKDVYHYHPVKIESVLLITDQTEADSVKIKQQLQQFSPQLCSNSIHWHLSANEKSKTTEALLQEVEAIKPDLICSYRNLYSNAWQFPHSLGEHLDVLLQHTTIPVLVIPHPKASYAGEHALTQSTSVMVVTDHLTLDHDLVHYGVAFTSPGGNLHLSHIEDKAYFQRIIKAISKIATINTDDAQEKLAKQLLKEPHDFIRSCPSALAEANINLNVIEHVSFGHHIKDYKKLIEDHELDLLVMNTKDEDQLAMHGIAYPLAVELRQIPLLML
ncbi:hypothetical protein [Spartinivicinus poritis]|uniref:Universal stress protein n=1 Tax=Spartinivicinus poritis TaxID=2994640 RepID=A0ABT5UIN9_9GAMM|nr:hypothetical protein [Spartinivicinus sp. A2-2]MDE1465387.1 hypothetical protein [Spartinivicinus sp. A2-2]